MPFSPTSALLVIDAQASFPARPYWVAGDVPAWLHAQNALIAGFAAQKRPVIRVFHVESEGAFSKASGLVRALDGLIDFDAALTIEKHAHSAFVGTTLGAWLTQHGIRDLTISGIRSEQCCETTTRHGSDLGFNMHYVTDATLTFPMRHANGRVYTSQEIKERCELVLDGRFATINTVDAAIARAASHEGTS
jgi:nicotinamidase-related amidase